MKAIELKSSLSLVIILFMLVFLLIYFFVPFADTAPKNNVLFEDLSASQQHNITQIMSKYDITNKIPEHEESLNCDSQWQYQQAIYTFPKINRLSFQEKVVWTHFSSSSKYDVEDGNCQTLSVRSAKIRKNTVSLQYNY